MDSSADIETLKRTRGRRHSSGRPKPSSRWPEPRPPTIRRLIAHQKLRDREADARALRPALGAHSRLLDQIELQSRGTGELRPPRTRSPPRWPRPRPRRWRPSPASARRASRSPSICRASGWSCPGPTACLCCGGARLRKLGENVTETLEVIPRQWKVIQHVREKFTCRDCEKISQAPAPFHVIARGWAGPSLLAMILFEKFGQHQPLNRQAERYAKEGVPLSLSTLADQVGAGCAVLEPLLRRIEAHVFAAERLHGDDTTVPVLAKGKTDTGRCWVYVRDDRPFGGSAPPAAMFYYSRDRAGEHPRAHLALCRDFPGRRLWRIQQALRGRSQAGPDPGGGLLGPCPPPVLRMADIEASARRKAQGKTPAPISPLALEAVRRIDRPVRDRARDQRARAPTSAALSARSSARRWSPIWKPGCASRAPKLSRGNDVAKAMDYMLKRWTAFTRFLDDGRICLSNNAAERGAARNRSRKKVVAIRRLRSRRQRAAAMYSLIVTAKMNDVDPQAWLADVLARIAEHPAHRLDELLPWNWRPADARSARQPDHGRHHPRLHHQPCRRNARRGRGLAAGTLKSTWTPKTAACGSTASVRTAARPSPNTASSASSKSSSRSGDPHHLGELGLYVPGRRLRDA